MPKGKMIQIITIAILAIFASISLSGCNNKADYLVLSGTIESTQYEVISEVAGKVIKIEKEEGSTIQTGDTLAYIDAALQELVVKQQEAVINLKQAKLEELKAGTRSEQIRQAEAGVDAAKSAVNAAETSVESAQINYDYWLEKYDRAKTLHSSNAVSDDNLNDTKYKVDSANQQLVTVQKQLNSTHAQLQSAQSQLDLLRSGATGQAIKAAEAELTMSEAALQQSQLVLGKHQVKSPVNGTLISKNINLGDMVNTGTSLGTISDLTDLWVRVYIPQRNINIVKLNQEIELTTVSLPNKSIKGQIVFIADEAEFTPKNTETSEAKENTVFKLKIKIMDNIESLRPGMTINATIPLGGN